jgi:hypothetical protein
MFNLRLAALVFACCRASPVLAADCSDVLRVAYDQTSTAFDTTSVNVAKQLACSNKKVFTNNNGSLGYEDILSVSGSTSKDEVDAWCNGSSSFDFIDQKFRQAIQAVNPLVVNQWGLCMDAYGVKVGLTAALDPNTNTPRILIVFLQYNAPTPGQKAYIKNVPQLSNISCQDLPKPGEGINVRQNYTCTRTNQFDPSTISFTFTNVPSPDPIIVPGLPRPAAPKFQLTGAYVKADRSVGVTVVQSGSDIGWSAESTDYSMTMQGGYYTDTKAVGIQRRRNKAGTPCENQMTVQITALGDHYWSHTSDYRSGPTCDIVGPGFHEGPIVYRSQ